MTGPVHVFFEAGYELYPGRVALSIRRRAVVTVEGRVCTKHRYIGDFGALVDPQPWVVLPRSLTKRAAELRDVRVWSEVVVWDSVAGYYASLAAVCLPVPIQLRHVQRLADRCGEPTRAELQALWWAEAGACLT